MNTEDIRGHWRQVLQAVGVDEQYLRDKHGPCPGCGGKDRYRFTNHDNAGMFFCNQCGAGDGFKLLEMTHGWDFKTAIAEIEKIIGTTQPEKHEERDGRLPLRRVCSELIPAADSLPVRSYLQARGLKPAPGLKAHPDLPYYENGRYVDKFPAMVGVVLNHCNEGVTLHRTYIENGRKAPVSKPKKFMTLPAGMELPGAAIRLYEHDKTLGIAEGVETAMAASTLFDIPVWSVLFDRGLPAFKPPVGVTNIVIFGDRDKSFSGQSAAYEAAKRLTTAGFKVRVRLPHEVGMDWNDALLQQRRSA